MEERRNIKKIRIVRPVIIEGKHAAAGEVHSLPRHTALDIISSGCAVEHLDKGEVAEPAPTTVRVEAPIHGDPKPQHGDPAPDKRAPEKPKTKSAS